MRKRTDDSLDREMTWLLFCRSVRSITVAPLSLTNLSYGPYGNISRRDSGCNTRQLRAINGSPDNDSATFGVRLPLRQTATATKVLRRERKKLKSPHPRCKKKLADQSNLLLVLDASFLPHHCIIFHSSIWTLFRLLDCDSDVYCVYVRYVMCVCEFLRPASEKLRSSMNVFLSLFLEVFIRACCCKEVWEWPLQNDCWLRAVE